MAPYPPRRAIVLDELHETLRVIEEELQALRPHMHCHTPPTWAVVQHRELVQLSHRTCEMLLALEDAQAATTH